MSTHAETPHGHQVTLADSLDFVNTLEHDRAGDEEHLPDVATALEWLHARSLLHDDMHDALRADLALHPKAGPRVLAEIHRVRDAMRELMDATVARRPPAARQLGLINRALRSPFVYELVPAPDGVSMDHRHSGDPIHGALARLVEVLAREVSQGQPDRLRVCANDDCRMVFADTSRTGRRRWCDMAVCGNRAKAARHRERRREASATCHG